MMLKINYLTCIFLRCAIIVRFLIYKVNQNNISQSTPKSLVETTFNCTPEQPPVGNETFLERKTYRKENYEDSSQSAGKSDVTAREIIKKPKERICVKLIKEMGDDNNNSKMV